MTATSSRTTLPDFEGLDVAKAAVKITNAGDGLSEALKVSPIALAIDDEVFYVLRGSVTQVSHRTDKDDVLTRVHTVKASEITEIDADTARQMLAAAADRLARAKAEIDGQLMLDAEAEALEAEQLDETGTPGEIADAAAERVKDPRA